MKKVISLLLAATMTASFAVTASAAAGNMRFSADKTEYEAGETIAIKISTLEKSIATEGFDVEFDESKVTYKNITLDGSEITAARKITYDIFYGGDKSDTDTVKFAIAEKNATLPIVGFGYAATEDVGVFAKDEVITVNFTVNDGATGDIKFTLNENSDGASKYVGVCDTLTVSVKSETPAGPTATPADTSTMPEAAQGRKVWNVTKLDASKFTESKVIAVLTNTTRGESVEKEIILGFEAGSGDIDFNLYTNKLQNPSDEISLSFRFDAK